MPQPTQVFHFSLRWTIQNIDGDPWDHQETMKKTLEENFDKWIFQLEDTVNNLHFQGYAHAAVKNRPQTLAVAMNNTLRGIEVQRASTAGIQALKKYALKSDTRVQGPWADHPIYLGEDLPTQLYDWQEKLKNYLLGPVNDREIIWCFNREGNNGKSTFAKYMAYHHDITKLTYGDRGDLLNLVAKIGPKRAYIFDLTRTKPKTMSWDDVISTMEDIKTGHFINTKYETNTVIMSKPHIVVMANYPPNRKAMSQDMWTIVELPEGESPRDAGKRKFSLTES